MERWIPCQSCGAPSRPRNVPARHAGELSVSRGELQSVLMFHGVGEAGHSFEPGEQNYWVSWEQFDAMLGYCAGLSPKRYRFTFDDGNASDVEAARRMRKRGVTGSFFVLMGRLGAPGYLTRDEIGEMLALEMEIGLHGRDHVDWRGTDDATLRSEVDLAAEELAELCGRRITSAAIPYGLYDRRIWRYLERSPFERIYTSDRGPSRRGDRFVRRDPVMNWHNPADVADMVAGKASPVARLRRSIMPRLKRLK